MLADDFEPREGFEPRGLRDARSVQIWYSPEVARWRARTWTARLLKRRLGDRRGRSRRRGLADRRDPLVPRRGRGARAEGAARADRRSSAQAPGRAGADPRPRPVSALSRTGRLSVKVAPASGPRRDFEHLSVRLHDRARCDVEAEARVLGRRPENRRSVPASELPKIKPLLRREITRARGRRSGAAIRTRAELAELAQLGAAPSVMPRA
mgnify:CR=1 FL=1